MAVRAPARLPRGFTLAGAPAFPYRGPRPRGTAVDDNIPVWFPGSNLEWLVYRWLSASNVEFLFQVPIAGGRVEKGGIIADFVLTDRIPPVILRAQGFHWHGESTSSRARDLEQKLVLTDLGFEVVDLRESDLTTNLDYAMRQAIAGLQIF